MQLTHIYVWEVRRLFLSFFMSFQTILLRERKQQRMVSPMMWNCQQKVMCVVVCCWNFKYLFVSFHKLCLLHQSKLNETKCVPRNVGFWTDRSNFKDTTLFCHKGNNLTKKRRNFFVLQKPDVQCQKEWETEWQVSLVGQWWFLSACLSMSCMGQHLSTVVQMGTSTTLHLCVSKDPQVRTRGKLYCFEMITSVFISVVTAEPLLQMCLSRATKPKSFKTGGRTALGTPSKVHLKFSGCWSFSPSPHL